MPYDLTALSDYLDKVEPFRVVLQLDHALYDLVLNADFYENTDGLALRYHDLLIFRNVFATIAKVPHIKPDHPF